VELSTSNRLVRPRIRPPDPEASVTLLLEDAIAERLARGETGVLWIRGQAGAGKRTALAYLRDRFSGDERVEVDSTTRTFGEAGTGPSEPHKLFIRACRKATRKAEVLELAPWSRDECIEYLLARHPTHCTSVMQRFGRGGQPVELGGVPLLLTAVLDVLAADETLPGEFEALRTAIVRAFETPELLAKARALAFESIPSGAAHSLPDKSELVPSPDWLRQIPVLLVLAAEAITILLEGRNGKELPISAPDAEQLRVARPLLVSSPAARAEATRMLERGPPASQPWAASLVHLEGPDALAQAWPKRSLLHWKLPRLAGARLGELQAAELDFSRVEASDIDLRGAILDRCDLNDASLLRGRFARASLRGAQMRRIDAKEADFSGADLEGADAYLARFDGANLDGTNLRGALLKGATLEGCSLRGTRAAGADCAEANLARLDMRAMQGLPARLAKAGLMQANLEGQSAEAPDFSAAELTGALLSGTRFPRANFQGAILRNAGLAWIDWSGANLFDADLTGASFHLGSSRSGLVFNAPAGWGTRTGFYTDELRDQSFKAPEEIRKACLRGADLRKALIFQTDFYLVDVREALYTPDQEKHLRSCGAILGS